MYVLGMVIRQVLDVKDIAYRVDSRMIESRMRLWKDQEGRPRHQLTLKLHKPLMRRVSYRGNRLSTFPCRSSDSLYGLKAISWNCKQLGIEGPSIELDVLISKHALERLHERLPLSGCETLLHRGIVEAFKNPVLHPQGMNSYFVEFRLGEDRLGYFVAEVLPGFVLSKTFLFLTMHGTPEAERLREKLGLSRTVVEHYELDQFFTLVGSDVVKDPLLVKVLSECGCGHLISLIDPTDRLEWMEQFGQRMKNKFDIKDAGQGFMVGQKWMRWNDQDQATPSGN